MKKFVLTLTLITLPTLACAKDVLKPPYEIKEIKTGIEEQHQDKPTSDICKDFTMDKKQVRDFLNKAVAITKRQRHDEYSWLPCFVTATALKDGQTIQVKIWAAILGQLTYPDGKTVLIADPSKKDKPE
ncbi:MAG: hypothetical protein R3257_06690 [bacterium]|nr:hypothetical protein [bacterium]